MILAQRSGMDLNLFWHSIRASAGNSFLWETAGPNIFRGEYHDSFNMDLMCKDIQLCFEMAKSAKVIPFTVFHFLTVLGTLQERSSLDSSPEKALKRPQKG